MGIRGTYHLVDDYNSEICESLEIDKTWQAIHFVLSGQKTGGVGSLAKVVLNEDSGLPPDFPVPSDADIIYLNVEAIFDINHALKTATKEWFRDRFSISDMIENGIYPFLKNETINEDEYFYYVYSYFIKIIAFFIKAEQNKKAILLVIT